MTGATSEPLMVGNSIRTQQVLRNVDKVARGRWPVLILGETGTGKEVVARSIYQAAPEGPFVTIDCSSLVGPLLESELFGHARGAFTGAVGQKLGLIELANGGTAFFDEIGELPLDLQAKLLRVLQEKEFRPVGSLSAKRSDFRLVAATNRDLLKEVERGNFRRDLYYRLNVVTIKLAPLRDRKDDIPVLAGHFLSRYGRGHRLSEDVIDAFVAYEWPGNVRELENCVQQMVAINTGPCLHLTDMPTTVQNYLHARRGQAMHATASASASGTGHHVQTSTTARIPPQSEDAGAILPLEEVEKIHIQRALHAAHGDRSRAAFMLRIGRTTLYRKIKQYDLVG
ncbi:MAG: sigma 54-interacting transcriptional regulator [Bryobacteraceae bacterium]